MAGANDGSGLAVDEDAERIPIAGEDRIDRRALIDDLGLVTWIGRWRIGQT